MPLHRLSDQTHAAIEAAVALIDRDQTLADLRDLLDPAGRLSTWGLAGELSERLSRFQATAWPRIRGGHREPQGALEAGLSALCAAGCPSSQRRLFDLLAELGL